MEDEAQSSYRQIVKATSIFGGVQVFVILIGMIKTKFVAVLLGTTGVGLLGLINAPLTLIASFTGLGLSYSAVREVAKSIGTGNSGMIAKQVTIAERWILLAGFLGFLITLVLAPFLSKWTFGHYGYAWSFVFLSVTLLINSVTNGNRLMLQSFRMMSQMSKSTVIGAFVGLISSVPLYYWYGLNGIVPSIFISSITALIVSYFYSRQIPIERIKIPLRMVFLEGRSMVKLGVAMMLGGIVASVSNYFLMTYLSSTGGVDQVGLYSAGWNIVGQYVGVIFGAMTTDYFPRLAAVSDDNRKLRILINQQAEMATLILAPLLIFLIVLMPVFIKLFYTNSFIPAVAFVNWMVFGVLLKGVSWSIGFIFPAKGDTKTFLLIEISAAIFFLISNIIGYKYLGLEGLGITFVINYIFSIILTFIIAFAKYNFVFSRSFLRIFIILLVFVILGFISSRYELGAYTFWVGGFVLAGASLYSIYEMNQRMDLVSIINAVKRRYIN
jgi:O-antigen/teichoic acid export membrane protein